MTAALRLCVAWDVGHVVGLDQKRKEMLGSLLSHNFGFPRHRDIYNSCIIKFISKKVKLFHGI